VTPVEAYVPAVVPAPTTGVVVVGAFVKTAAVLVPAVTAEPAVQANVPEATA